MFDVSTSAIPDGDATPSNPHKAPKASAPRVRQVHPLIKKLKATEMGCARALMEDIRDRYPNNPLKQTAVFFKRFRIPAATGRSREASKETQENYQERINCLIFTLREMNMPVQNIDQISKKQIRLFFKHLESQGRSASWMANVNTAIRRFGIWIGKPELCPPVGELVENVWSTTRRVAAQADKSWGRDGEEFEFMLTRVAEVCPMTSLHLRLASLFGHRVTEILMFRPAEAIQGEFLHLTEGTKGGRTRMVPIETDEQRRWLEVALIEAAKNKQGRLQFEEGITLVQARVHLYSVLKACGLTREDAGLTAHGLRHGYACAIYKELTGEKAPIQGGAPIDPELDKRARLEIARRLGHGRVSVASAYLGSHAALKKYARENLERMDYRTKQDQVLQGLIQKAGLESLCVLGDLAKGATVAKNQPGCVAFKAKAMPGETQDQADGRVFPQMVAITAQLEKTLGRQFYMRPMSMVASTEDLFDLV